MHPSDRLAGGGEPSSQAFRGVVCLLKCHALFSWRKDTVDYRSNVRHVCHCVSDLAPSKMDFQASPRGGAEADFEALVGMYKKKFVSAVFCSIIKGYLRESR